MNFYNNLPKPIVGLSPMDGVTDGPMRYINAKYGDPAPDVLYTEFVSVDGVVRGIDRLFEDFIWHDLGVPVVAQIFGNEPEVFYEASQIVAEMRFAGIDINMGCPCKSVASRGGGAGLICTPGTAVEIVKATKAGVSFWYENGLVPNGNFINQKIIQKVKDFKLKFDLPVFDERKLVPVSVKTRIGYDQKIPAEWARTLLETEPAVLTMHGRTLKQMYTGVADWEALAVASAEVRKTQTLFFANGDIKTPDDAKRCLKITGADGLLVGRATFGDPFLIGSIINKVREKNIESDPTDKSINKLANIMLDHARIHIELKGPKALNQMRKHLAWYVHGLPNAAELRSKLVRINSIEDLELIVKDFA